jgi:hypothetical protein
VPYPDDLADGAASLEEWVRDIGGWVAPRARSHRHKHCRFVRPLVHFIPYLRTYSVPLFLKRQCDRTLGVPRRPQVQGLQLTPWRQDVYNI